MTGKRRFPLFFWFLGIALLLGSVLGVSWVLNPSRADNGSVRDNGAGPTPGEVICLGFVDVETGFASLYPVQHGQVVEVRAEENKLYKQGDVLLRIDSQQAAAVLKKAQAALALAQEQLRQARTLPQQDRDAKLRQQKAVVSAAKHKLAAAKKERDYRDEQYKKKILNKLLLEEAVANVRYLQSMVEAAEAQQKELEDLDVQAKYRLAEREVALRQTDVDRARLALRECDLVAPEDGEVLRVLVNKGEVLGDHPKQPAILFLPTARPRIIRAVVEQEFVARAAVGKPAIIEDDTRHGGRWTGKIQRLSDWYAHRRSIIQEPLQFNDVRTIECLVSLDPGQPPLRIGQRMRVIIGRSR
jgi:multidrug resistance efflux pump